MADDHFSATHSLLQTEVISGDTNTHLFHKQESESNFIFQTKASPFNIRFCLFLTILNPILCKVDLIRTLRDFLAHYICYLEHFNCDFVDLLICRGQADFWRGWMSLYVIIIYILHRKDLSWCTIQHPCGNEILARCTVCKYFYFSYFMYVVALVFILNDTMFA